MDGIFFDTGNTRGPLRYGQEAQDRDVQSYVEIVSYVKNFWRDYVLDREAVVITNVGGNANPRQIMEAHHDSLTLKEHNIYTYSNFYTGICPDDDPYWENDLRCVFHSNEDHNRDRKVWREAFGEDFITRFLRFAAEESFKTLEPTNLLDLIILFCRIETHFSLTLALSHFRAVEMEIRWLSIMTFNFMKTCLTIILYFNHVLVNGKNGINGQIVIDHVLMAFV